MSEPARRPVGQFLRDEQADLLARWVEVYRASPLRMPHPLDPASTGRLIAPILEGLADALGPAAAQSAPRGGGIPAPLASHLPASALIAGSTVVREVEKAAALVGALLASGGAGGFDVAALFYALRDTLAATPLEAAESEPLVRFAEWLAAVAFDAFATARVQAERERWREQLEDGTPVVLLTPELPAAFLVGRPDGVLLDSVLSRLLLLVVRVGARAALLDATGLAEPARPEVLEALRRFLSHRKVIGGVSIVAIGVADEAESAWREVARASGTQLSFDAHCDRAVAQGLSLTGYRLVR